LVVARWQPNASGRLLLAALELFEEHGYENTTVIEIAERAGLTKSTFFRYFPDKREVLFGGETIHGLLVDGIAAAPAEATPLEAVANGLGAIGTEAFTPVSREFSARRRAVIAANPELQEREALKGLSLTASMTDALKRRGVPDLTSSVAADLGALALKVAYQRWSDTDGQEFSEVARRTLGELQAASAMC
jgi:AcrR family transcriptional regulator